MSLPCFWLLMMKMEEGGVSPLPLYRWLHQVRHTHTHSSLNCKCYITDPHFRSPSVTVFTESVPSDSGDNMASQSVPMVTASTGMAAAADDGDEVFMEQEREG